MSKQVSTAVSNKLVRESIERVIADCGVKDCELCAEMRRQLDETKQTDDLNLID